jgi:hypothetical protein
MNRLTGVLTATAADGAPMTEQLSALGFEDPQVNVKLPPPLSDS